MSRYRYIIHTALQTAVNTAEYQTYYFFYFLICLHPSPGSYRWSISSFQADTGFFVLNLYSSQHSVLGLEPLDTAVSGYLLRADIVAAILSAKIQPGCSDRHLHSLSHNTQGLTSVSFKVFGVYKPAGSRKSATKAEEGRRQGREGLAAAK